MSTFWKVLIGLALALPMTAYVVASLLASAAEEPGPRDPVRVSDVSEAPTPDQKRSKPPATNDPDGGPGDDDAPTDDDERDADDSVDDNGVRVVVPQPTRVGEADDDDRPEGNDGDSRDGGDDSGDSGGD